MLFIAFESYHSIGEVIVVLLANAHNLSANVGVPRKSAGQAVRKVLQLSNYQQPVEIYELKISKTIPALNNLATIKFIFTSLHYKLIGWVNTVVGEKH